jgi:hypothetical protein
MAYCVSWNPVKAQIAASYSDGTVFVWDAHTGEPVWLAVVFDAGAKAAVFSAAGELLHGDPADLEPSFLYIVDDASGKREFLKPSEFRKRIADHRTRAVK